MKKLICLDLDGTLLNDDKVITKRNKECLLRLQEEGHIVVLASGRPKRAMVKYHQELNLPTPLICYNGAQVSKESSDYYDLLTRIDRNIIFELIDYIDFDLIKSIRAETDEVLFLNQEEDPLKDFFSHHGLNIIKGNIKKELNVDPFSCFFELSSEPSEELKTKIRQKFSEYEFSFFKMLGSYYMRFIKLGTSKWSEINKLHNHYQTSEVICFGDAFNDVEMLKCADHGVLMINGHKELRGITKNITRYDNNQDGIADYLEEVLGL